MKALMQGASRRKFASKFLFFSGLFIIALGLFYGAPKSVVESSFGVSIDDNALHILRAVMGLYCGVGCLVLVGAKHKGYTNASLLLEAVFFGGIGCGRLISFAIDGNIGRVAVGAVVIELLLCTVCFVLLREKNKKSPREYKQSHTIASL